MIILLFALESYISNNVSIFENLFSKIFMGILNVLFLIITIQEWFEIDERLEAYSSLSERLNYWEDEYISIAKEYERLQKSIDETGGQ